MQEFYCSQRYGGTGGSNSSDGTYSGITRITMTVKDDLLTSIQLHYVLEGDESMRNTDFSGFRHGETDGTQIVYNINYPQEIVTKISGYLGSYNQWPIVAVKSLTFHTNKRKIGPCGQEQGTHFESKVRGKIVGIFASSGLVVDSIGVYMLKPRTSKDEVFYRSELYGGRHKGAYWNDGTYSGIQRIAMTAKDNSLTSVQLHYVLEGDESKKDIIIPGLRHGHAEGTPLIEYNLNYPEEIVTKISGCIGGESSSPVIKSLTFHTNQRKLGPSGQEQGDHFETESGGRIVGFYGTSGAEVYSIGVYTLKPRTSKKSEFCCSQIYGGTGGSYKSDGTYSGIKRIIVTVKDNLLTSVQLHYGLEGDEDVKDRYFPGLLHGCEGGIRIEYNLNYPEEIVTKISGYFGSYEPWPLAIKSLTFHTNKRKYGPCGQEDGTYFETEVGGKIVGIFASSGDVVDSIGLFRKIK